MAVELKSQKPIRLGTVKYHCYRKENSAYRFFTIETEKFRTHFSINAMNDMIKDLQDFIVLCGRIEHEEKERETSKAGKEPEGTAGSMGTYVSCSGKPTE